MYSLGMCIIEALCIVEYQRERVADAPDNEYEPCYPWGSLDNASVKYHVQHGALPLQPANCTGEQWELIKKMCRRDPTERIKISAVAYNLKRFADSSRATGRDESIQPEPLLLQLEIESYKDGELTRLWDVVKRQMSEGGDDQLQKKALQAVDQLFNRLYRSSQPWELLQEFESLLDCFGEAIGYGFRQH